MPGIPPARFAYLGPRGTFTEAALLRLPAARNGTRLPMRSVPEALDAVRDGDADAALVPIENSQEGSVSVTLDALANGDPLLITAEVVLPVTFVLAERDDAKVDTIASHPHALAQCRSYLRQQHPEATTIETLSTSAAAQMVAEGTADAGICAPLAAEQQHLRVLAHNIGDVTDAVTRFVLITKPSAPAAPGGNDITSLAVYIAHDQVGALLRVLTELSTRGVNLTRIESRPTGEKLGRYAFFLDCTGHIADVRVGEALMGLRRVCADVRFLGSYPRDTDEAAIPAPPGLRDSDYAFARQWWQRLRDTGQPF